MRRYFIFVTKKCRIYAACGVSQTPNTSLDGEENIEAVLMEETPKKAEGFILHGGLNDYNEFGKEPVLYEKPLDVQLTQRGVKFVVPACSVVTVRVY